MRKDPELRSTLRISRRVGELSVVIIERQAKDSQVVEEVQLAVTSLHLPGAGGDC